MYYPDLSKYEYWSHDPGGYVLNVGWLEKGHKYQQGVVSPLFLARLELFYRPVFLTFGYHICDFCDAEDVYMVILGKRRVLGSSEIRVIGENVIYASPTMIYHYITEHQYKPPDAFMQAVMTQPIPGEDPTFEKIYGNFG